MELSILHSLLVILIAIAKLAIIIIVFLIATTPMGFDLISCRVHNPKINESNAHDTKETDIFPKRCGDSCHAV